MSLCRVGAEAVSLALLAHLWIGVYAIHVPDSPGAGAHAREATGTMQHPYGKSIPQDPAIFPGRPLLGRAEDTLHSLLLLSRLRGWALLPWLVSLGSGNRMPKGGLSPSPGLQASLATLLLDTSTGNCLGPHPILPRGRIVHTLGPGCPESPRGPASPGSPRDP